MAIQIEGKSITLRWDNAGLFITKHSSEDFTKPSIFMNLSPEEAIEFTSLFTMGQHAISVGEGLQFMFRNGEGN